MSYALRAGAFGGMGSRPLQPSSRPQPRPRVQMRSSSGGAPTATGAEVPGYTPVVVALLASALGIVAYGQVQTDKRIAAGWALHAEHTGQAVGTRKL